MKLQPKLVGEIDPKKAIHMDLIMVCGDEPIKFLIVKKQDAVATPVGDESSNQFFSHALYAEGVDETEAGYSPKVFVET